CLVLLAGVLGIAASPQVLASNAHPSATTHRYTAVCSVPARSVHCDAFVFTSAQRKPLIQPRIAGPIAGSYGPAQFHIGYSLPCSVGGTSAQAICAQPSSFGKQTIAIVDAYNAPTIQADLNAYDSYYNHPGIAVMASSGDGGYQDGFGVEYPSASPYVVAVGGTTLNLNSNNTYLGESVWGDGGFDAAGAGSGCSMYENANAWQ